MSLFLKRALLLFGTVIAMNGFVISAQDAMAETVQRTAASNPQLLAKADNKTRKNSRNRVRSTDWAGRGLSIRSSAALVLDQRSGEVLYEKQASRQVPIASITKLMTAMVVLDAGLDLDEVLTITRDDVDTLKNSYSRLPVGTRLTREQTLLLALMSSANRAAHTLSRFYPGGEGAFVAAMNRKADAIGMANTRFVGPTGLSSDNVSTAADVARLVDAAYSYPLIREFTTTSRAKINVGRRPLRFQNTNSLVNSSRWTIGLSKTGYISEAGKCLVMQTSVADRSVVIVLLGASSKRTRIADAQRIKRWVERRSMIAAREVDKTS